MKPKKPKPRYYNPQQINDKIRKYREKLRHFLAMAESLDMEAKMLIQAGPKFSEDRIFKLERAKKMRRSAQRIEEKTIPHLVQKLAEINTELLPGIITNGDRSIPTKG